MLKQQLCVLLSFCVGVAVRWSSKKIVFSILTLILSFNMYASEQSISILLNSDSDTMKAYRYQSGQVPDGLWKEVPASTPILVLDGFDRDNDLLYVQQSQDSQSWGEIYRYQYKSATESWELVPKDKTTNNSIEMKGNNLYPYGKSTTCYSYILGAGLKFNFALGKQNNLFAYSEIGYSRGPAKSDWVDAMQATSLSAGFGYRIPLTNQITLAPELDYGLLLHILNADFDQDGIKQWEVFTDQQVRLSLNLSYAINDTNHVFIAPLGLVFFQNSDVGILYGVQAGIRFTI